MNECKHPNLPPVPLVVGICGAAGAGKDTFAKGVAWYCKSKDIPYKRIALADALKELAAKVFDEAGREMFFDRENKEAASECLAFMSPRQVLQRLGMGAREVIRESVWRDIAHRKTKQFFQQVQPLGGVVAVPDIRFPDEQEWLRNFKHSCLVKVCRRDIKPVRNHVTEQHWRDMFQDIHWWNEATTEDEAVSRAYDTFAKEDWRGYE